MTRMLHHEGLEQLGAESRVSSASLGRWTASKRSDRLCNHTNVLSHPLASSTTQIKLLMLSMWAKAMAPTPARPAKTAAHRIKPYSRDSSSVQ